MADTPAENRPSTPSAEYAACAPDVALVRDMLASTRRMHAKFRDYIPKFKAEKPESYKRRATGAKVYGGLGRTLSASVGMLFAKEPAFNDFSAEMEQHADNIDGKGTKLTVFAKRKSEDAIADGFTAILVDHPSTDGTLVTAASERAFNIRPLWASYTRADILSWRTATVDNVETLVQVVLREGHTAPLGLFGTTQRTMYRVCRLGMVKQVEGEPIMGASWVLLEEIKDGSGSVVVVERERGTFKQKDGTLFRQIPLAVIYAGRTDAILCAHQPLLDVAWANLEHWRVATNLRYYEDLCCFPQPTIEGELANDPATGIPRPFQLGPGVLVQLTANSKFTWSEVNGSSIQALRESLAEKKDEIAELGASFLAKKTRGVETAEAKRLDAAAENSTLATSAQGIEDGINEALRFHALYLGIPAEQAPTITINKDFDTGAMDAATMTAYVTAVRDAGLDPVILLQAWQAGGRIAPDVDVEQMAAEMMARSQAEADAKAQAAADALTMNTPPEKMAA